MTEAGETLAQQQAAVQSADRAAAGAQSQLDALDDHMRQVARAASTASRNGMAELDLLTTSGSAEEFVPRLVTPDVIARRPDEVLGELAESAAAAQQGRTEADAARAAAQRTLDDVTARQARLEADIAEYEVQYDALSAPQQQEVVAGQSMAAAPAAAAGGAAQTAVDTALARSVTPTCGAPVGRTPSTAQD